MRSFFNSYVNGVTYLIDNFYLKGNIEPSCNVAPFLILYAFN